jgi:hypothetical protein
MPCAHAELERCRLARNPAAYGFSGINATALDCRKDVERPEDPITKLHEQKVSISNTTVRRVIIVIILVRTVPRR